MRRCSLTLVVCAAAAVVMMGTGAHAQTNAEVNAAIQFNFSTPGARSLGLGGAFVGLADDATAAFTNPAGLTALSKMEVSFEARQWEYTNTYTWGGRSFGEPNPDYEIDTAGITTGEASDSTTGLSFLSFVYPREKWAIAVYRHELANFETRFRTQGAYFDAFDDLGDGYQEYTFRFYPVDAFLELDIVNYGTSAAFRLGDNFNLGVGVSYYDFQLDSTTNRYGMWNADFPEDPGGFWGVPDYSASNVLNYQEQTGDDTDVAFNLGFLWKLGEKFSLGGVYRQGPSFSYNTRNVAGPAAANPGEEFAAAEAEFNVPDVYGLGFAIRATDAFTVAFDYSHVKYSSLTDNIVNIFSEPAEYPDQDEAADRLTVDDADELHLGLEYVFVNAKYPVALRFGSWYDPDHRVRFDGDPGEGREARALATSFREGDDELHYSAGIGFIFGETFQLDAAADFSDNINTLSLSGVVRF